METPADNAKRLPFEWSTMPNRIARSSFPTNSAAIQRNLARSVGLGLAPSLKDCIRTTQTKISTSSKIVISAKSLIAARYNQEATSSQLWVCESCATENVDRGDDYRDYCSLCHTRRDPISNQASTEKEVPDKGCNSRISSSKLSSTEWSLCEQLASKRNDLKHPCSICWESFGSKEPVILSCSHVFHVDCLASFERFLQVKDRVCPLCRKQNYEAKKTTIAFEYHRQQSAITLQAACRGFLARRKAELLYRQFYREGKGDPQRRRTFLANRMSRAADRLLKANQKHDDSIDAFLQEFDRSLSLSRRMFGQDDEVGSKEDWASIYAKAMSRNESDCAICLNAFGTPASTRLLSCSHMFHDNCLSSFETFNIYECPLCPMCRMAYRSRCCADLLTS